ncbi:VOC family protein [Oceanobacillus piezotolerans]|uniref:VOC family protein n=1 Tax=Oceanobacillus piezotolerans TaxID=2448030 RepID=A0A498DA63_9BACI|nr:VOC family protein [Oceanobacillus piezotolerans]RLL45531.1 VOC family protein [Oceanobacillus piezotolerans]
MLVKLWRVGTTYIPVANVERSSEWYQSKLEAKLSFKDEDKAIMNLANQSFFLVKAKEGESANFYDRDGEKHFSLTFEVNGLDALESLHRELSAREVVVGHIENRGHAGRNFVFSDIDGNLFDVWSELSQEFKEKYL